MSKELDYFIDLNIDCEDTKQAEELIDFIEDNEEFVADWDLDGVDDDGTPLEGAIISIQFQSVLSLVNFTGKLAEKGYEL